MKSSLDVVLPVYNESKSLMSNFEKLYKFMELKVERDWIITIAENGSSDNTLDIAKKIQSKYQQATGTPLKKVINMKKKIFAIMIGRAGSTGFPGKNILKIK